MTGDRQAERWKAAVHIMGSDNLSPARRSRYKQQFSQVCYARVPADRPRNFSKRISLCPLSQIRNLTASSGQGHILR